MEEIRYNRKDYTKQIAELVGVVDSETQNRIDEILKSVEKTVTLLTIERNIDLVSTGTSNVRRI